MFLEITKDSKGILADWMIGCVGRCPTPRQGETPLAPAGTSATCQKDSAVGHIGRIGPIGRSCAGGLPKTKAWRAKPAMPLQAPGPDVCLARTHGPPSASCLCVPLWFFVFFVIAAQRSVSSPPRAAAQASTSDATPSLQASMARPACASTPLICNKSAKSAVPHTGSSVGGSRPKNLLKICEICGSRYPSFS